MSILDINRIALELVARDFSDGHNPTNGGPTKTSRALAIIHLAAHDAYAKVAGGITAKLPGLPNPPAGLKANAANGNVALLGAGLRACRILYPDDVPFIASKALSLVTGVSPVALHYGEQVADLWIASRANDGSNSPQLDANYSNQPGRHRPDPLNLKQLTLGRTWGLVRPFVPFKCHNRSASQRPSRTQQSGVCGRFR